MEVPSQRSIITFNLDLELKRGLTRQHILVERLPGRTQIPRQLAEKNHPAASNSMGSRVFGPKETQMKALTAL